VLSRAPAWRSFYALTAGDVVAFGAGSQPAMESWSVASSLYAIGSNLRMKAPARGLFSLFLTLTYSAQPDSMLPWYQQLIALKKKNPRSTKERRRC
jgi:lipase chaperone LimK